MIANPKKALVAWVEADQVDSKSYFVLLSRGNTRIANLNPIGLQLVAHFNLIELDRAKPVSRWRESNFGEI